jgi:UDP:flavonoid glycosyltransferase YjiC (YdhE family)
MTGYWYLDTPRDFEPPRELDTFLNSGTPPVYIGYGSMIAGDPKETLELILQALSITKQRGIVESGGGLLLVGSPDNLLKIGSVPHDWLFPRMAVVVHHGGAGTTATGIRAGVPSVAVPFIYDQPFWGRRLADLGVGTEPIPFRKLSVQRLANAISRAVSDQGMREKAARLGSLIRSEDGVNKAVGALNHIFSDESKILQNVLG